MSHARNTIANALSQIEKRFGVDTIASEEAYDFQTIDTGSMLLNAAIGNGGWPEGSIIEIYGEPDSGKTTMLLLAIAAAQRVGLKGEGDKGKGRKCAFIDAEKRFDPQYAKMLGVNIEELIVIDPDTGEEGLEIVRILAAAEDIGVIAVDSVAALMPQIEQETAIGDSIGGIQARMMSEALQKLCNVVHENHVVVIFSNQLRMKLPANEGEPAVSTSPGGNALKHYARVRVELRKAQDITNNFNEVVASVSAAKIVLNKVGKRGAIVPLHFISATGINANEEMLELGLRYKVISIFSDSEFEDEEPHYFMKGQSIGRSRHEAITVLATKSNPQDYLFKSLRDKGVMYQPLKQPNVGETLLLERDNSAPSTH